MSDHFKLDKTFIYHLENYGCVYMPLRKMPFHSNNETKIDFFNCISKRELNGLNKQMNTFFPTPKFMYREGKDYIKKFHFFVFKSKTHGINLTQKEEGKWGSAPTLPELAVDLLKGEFSNTASDNL